MKKLLSITLLLATLLTFSACDDKNEPEDNLAGTTWACPNYANSTLFIQFEEGNKACIYEQWISEITTPQYSTYSYKGKDVRFTPELSTHTYRNGPEGGGEVCEVKIYFCEPSENNLRAVYVGTHHADVDYTFYGEFNLHRIK